MGVVKCDLRVTSIECYLFIYLYTFSKKMKSSVNRVVDVKGIEWISYNTEHSASVIELSNKFNTFPSALILSIVTGTVPCLHYNYR